MTQKTLAKIPNRAFFPMGLKCLLFFSYTVLVILSTECALKSNTSEISSNNHHIRCIVTERKALLKLKSSLQSSYTGLLKSWGREGHEEDCCKWSGVECSSATGHVTRLDLSRSYNACTIDASLVELRHLSYLNLSYNDHEKCSIPEFIGHLSKLEELDLSSSGFGGRIPHQLGNLSLLKFLDLSMNDFNGSSIPESFKFLGNIIHLSISESNIGGKIQDQLRNLSKMQSLDLSYNYRAYVDRLEWVCHLYSLRYLQLNGFNLSKAIDWGQSLIKLPHLTELHMSDSDLDIAPPTVTPENASSSLLAVDLSLNMLTSSSIFTWLLNFNNSLSEIYLGNNSLRGPIPSDFWSMPLLFYLDIRNNELEGEIPGSFGSSLSYLVLANNYLSGNLSNSIAQLHKLTLLLLSDNSLHGIISGDHLSNFTNLKYLSLSSNSLTLSLDPCWIPPFQLYFIGLRSCHIGPLFPRWLQTQTSFYVLDISFNQISGTLPNWFLNSSSKASYLNISNNKIHGKVPIEAFSQNPIAVVDFSSNYFEGRLPLFNPRTTYINLSKNNFTGTLTSLCNLANPVALDLSDNDLSGKLPQCWKEKSYNDLVQLSLSNNDLIGDLHNSLCSSASHPRLTILQLRSNRFTGELPSSMSNCTNLKVLDVASNMISGSIPEWIGHKLWDLRVLILQSNRFTGSIPLNLCKLQLLQIMDFSRNYLTGPIVDCLHNSIVLTRKRIGEYPYLFGDSIFVEIYPPNVIHSLAKAVSHLAKEKDVGSLIGFEVKFHERIMWKGIEYEYNKNLKDMVVVDFSSNKLQGEIPKEFGSLVALLQLNLSNNNLSGRIPKRICELRMLEVLDFSSNHLSGEIPQSISNLSFLDDLNLSYNSLSGQIPKGTQIQSQSASSFIGNPGLCGDPLPKKCHHEELEPTPPSSNIGSDGEEKNEFISEGFYISMGIGFVIGFWGVLGTILFHKSWSSTYFRFLNNIADWVYMRSAFLIAKIPRK